MARDVVLETGVDTSGIAAGMAHLRKTVKDSESEIRGSFASMFAAGTVLAAAHGIFEYGSRVAELKEKFAVSAEALQRFGNAAELTGSSLEAVAGAFNKLEINRSKAIGGSQKMIEAFEALGVSVEDLQALSPDQLMEKIAHSSLDAADLVKILGRSALALRPALEGIADGSLHAGAGIQEGLIDKIHAVDITLKAFGQSSRAWLADIMVTIIKGADFLGTEVEAVFANVAQQVDLAKSAIGGLLKGDLTSFREKAGPAADGTAAQALRDAFQKRYDGSDNGSTPKRRGATGGIDDEDALLQAVKGSRGEGGSGGRNDASLQEHLAKIERDRYLNALEKEKQIEVIARERGALQNYLTEGKKAGTISDEEAAKTQIDIYDRDAEIKKISDGIATAKGQAADEETRAREEVAKRAEHEQEALAAAREQTAEMRQEADGRADIAEQMRIEFEYQQKINQAHKDLNEDLAKELEAQKDLAKEEAKRAAAEKKRQADAEAAARAAEAAAKQKAADAQAQADRDAGQGTGINNNNPNYTDVALGLATDPRTGAVDPVRLARERALAELRVLRGQNTPYQQVFDANRNITTAAGYENAAAMARDQAQNIARQAQLTLQLNRPDLAATAQQTALLAMMLRQMQETHTKMAEPLG